MVSEKNGFQNKICTFGIFSLLVNDTYIILLLLKNFNNQYLFPTLNISCLVASTPAKKSDAYEFMK